MNLNCIAKALMKTLGVKVELTYKGDGRTGHANVQEYLMDVLKVSDPSGR